VSVPLTALVGVDDDGNGQLSLVEIQRHMADIQRQFNARFHVSDNGLPGTGVLSWVSSPINDGTTTEADYVVVMHRANFADVPTNPHITTDLFGTKADERQMTITATHGLDSAKVTEVAILNSNSQSHTFFRGRWSTFVDFVRIGVDHILSGPDHLLFLLTIVVATAGWRYWLGVVTSFTIAHSVTLALSALGVVRVPTNIIEPGIAASIVIMALLNLGVLGTSRRLSTNGRIAVVFGCGLLHGFGFASAIGAMAVDAGSRIATLAGFNVGIEFGQFLFLGGVLLCIALARQFLKSPPQVAVPTVASIIAAVLGTAMFISRVAPLV
jgi:hydrogenase/urease accessory protein HupE